jgi:hypothetical protein
MRSALRLLSGAILALVCAVTVFAQASQTGGITGSFLARLSKSSTRAPANPNAPQPHPATEGTRSPCSNPAITVSRSRPPTLKKPLFLRYR